jgi:glucose-1-phosphate cytidylyltransferase
LATKSKRFIEKPKGDGGWINAGFFVLSPKVIDLIKGDSSVWEAEPLKELAAAGQLVAYAALRILATDGYVAG